MTGPRAILAAALTMGAATTGLTRWPDPGDVVLVGGSPEAPARAWTVSACLEVDPFAHAPSEAWERQLDADGVEHELHGGLDTAPEYALTVQWVVRVAPCQLS